MLPQHREYYVHLVVEVVDGDPQPPLTGFPALFYQVVGLRARDAGFLLGLL